MDNMETKLRSIIENNIDLIVPIDDIGTEDDLSVLGINSVSFIKLVVEIEQEFDIEFEDDSLDFNNLKTIKDINDYIEKLLSAK